MTSKADFERMETPRPPLIWVTQCLTCNKELYAAPNGQFAEAVAKKHKQDSSCCKVLVGYEIK